MNTNDPEKPAHECGVAYHNALELREFERAVERRARTLAAGRPPEFNLAPTIELVRLAWFMGYDIEKRGPKMLMVIALIFARYAGNHSGTAHAIRHVQSPKHNCQPRACRMG